MGFPDQERFSLEDVAARWGKSVDYVRDFTRRNELRKVLVMTEWKLREGERFRRPGLRSFVEKSVLYEFEDWHGIHTAVHQPHLVRSPFLSDKLRIAVEASTAIYTSVTDQRKAGHKEAILRWLKKHHLTLSREAMERIAVVVNLNKRGGAPRQ